MEEEKKQWMVVGLIGGLISVISLTMPWLTLGVSKSSGWELTEIVASPYLLLFGGIFGMVGVALVLWRNELGGLIPIGGILSFLGWLWGYLKMREYLELGYEIGYGFWAGLLGSLMIMVSSLGLRKSAD